MEERDYFIALNALAGMAAAKKLHFIDQFGSAEMVFRSRDQITNCPSCRPSFIKYLLAAKPDLLVQQENKKAQAAQALIITLKDQEYPALLREIPDPPLAFYLKGVLPQNMGQSLAIVGSRKVSHYGRIVTEKLAQQLVEYGFITVSGLARGIDTIAHQTTIKKGGTTLAVLGNGLDVFYPPENKNLMRQMVEKGALLSEFPFGTQPHPMNFPIRNRIISGLCPGILVVEASEKSGALISANCALDQGREVFAVPGNITSPNSRGTNYLIKQGAKLVDQLEDILEEFGFQELDKKSRNEALQPSLVELNEGEEKLISFLSPDPTPIDFIIQKSGESAATIHSLLLTLEMKGVIKQLPGKLFCKL